jgi:fumarate hydratase subunit beta
MARKITTPLTDEVLAELRAGDEVELTGVIYTARDAAHRRLVEALEKGRPLPIDLKGQVIYYVGPIPPRPGQVIGSAGPTTALRMDTYTPPLLAAGLKATIGKGGRSQQLRELMKSHRAVYFGAIGGAGALLSRQIRKAEVVAYPDLGPEAIYRLKVEDFPLVVVDDIYGNDLLEMGKAQWRREVP